MKNKKISIIGSGFVGSNIAYSLSLKNIVDEIVLIDVNERLVRSEILDIKHGIFSFGSVNIYAGDYSDIKDSNVIIITAGRSRKANETRVDMVIENVKIAKTIALNIKKYYNNGLIMVVSNPVDVITYQLSKYLELDKNLIFGTGCMIDTSRFIFSVAEYVDCKTKDINGMVIGEHGDSQVFVWSAVKVRGLSIEEYCKLNNIKWTNEEKLSIEKNVTKMGANIISGKGKTHYGIATVVCYLSDIILSDKKSEVSLSTCLNGRYGIFDVALSVPCFLNKDGIEEVCCQRLNEDEMMKLINSAEVLKGILSKI